MIQKQKDRERDWNDKELQDSIVEEIEIEYADSLASSSDFKQLKNGKNTDSLKAIAPATEA